MTNHNYIYMDHNATTYKNYSLAPEVHNLPLNPSAPHKIGREAKNLLEQARQNILHKLSLKLKEYDLIFTSGATEANNIAMRSTKNKVFISPIEHPSIYNFFLHKEVEIEILKIHDSGLIDLDYLETKLKNTPQVLVSIMYANNETGIIQPVVEIKKICNKYEALFHCDATQAIQKYNVDLEGIDAISISGHKLGGPNGIGALIFKKNRFLINPSLIGGGQEKGNRPGTENVIGAAGFSSSINVKYEINKVTRLRDKLENQLTQLDLGAKIINLNQKRLCNTSAIYMPKVTSQMQLIKFDMHNICVSAGSACSSGKIKKSYVLEAMNLDEEIPQNTIRVSLGKENTEEEINHFTEIWSKICKNNI